MFKQKLRSIHAKQQGFIYTEKMSKESNIQCPFCFESISIAFFIEDGKNQETIVDCTVCCHPIECKVEFFDQENYHVEAARSN